MKYEKEIDMLIDINVNAESLAREAYATAFTHSAKMMEWVKGRAVKLLESLKGFAETSTGNEDGSVTKTITYSGKTYKITFPA